MEQCLQKRKKGAGRSLHLQNTKDIKCLNESQRSKASTNDICLQNLNKHIALLLSFKIWVYHSTAAFPCQGFFREVTDSNRIMPPSLLISAKM